MTEVKNPAEGIPPLLPRSVSALRSPKPPLKRVPTRPSNRPSRITIVEPKESLNNNKGDSAASATHSDTPPASRGYVVTSSVWFRKLILTLDGGGIRGYSALIILRALMKEIARIEAIHETPAMSSSETPNIPADAIPAEVLRKGSYLPCHYFDYIAGTGFGGLIGIMLGMLGMSVQECIDEFHRQNKSIPLTNELPRAINFPLLHRPSTWPTEKTRSFYDTFAHFAATATSRSAPPSAASSRATTESTSGEEASEFIKNTFQCQTIAWCTEVEGRERRPFSFCTYEVRRDEEKQISIPEVAKAITTPSSSSFKPFKHRFGEFVDGSKQIRDPTLEVVKEINWLMDVPGEPAIDLLLSLGTDEHTAWFYEKLRKRVVPPPGLSEEEKGRSYLDYHRFEVPNIKLGLRKKYFLREIEESTDAWLATQADQISQYAALLVQRRRARAETNGWETFALGVEYECFHAECQAKSLRFASRGRFNEHLEEKHHFRKNIASNDVAEQQLDRGRRFGVSNPKA